MSLIIFIGRRVPRAWLKRQVNRIGGILSFQEHIWLMIKSSLNLAKRKATASGKIKFIMTNETEIEDLNYTIEWLKIIIQGTKEQEDEEYQDTMKLYSPLGNLFKKSEMPKDERLGAFFKSKILSATDVEDAYKKGYGAVKDKDMASKLLEMGILTSVKLIDDYEARKNEVKTDF